MSARATLATARRVLAQLRHDRRTVAMLVLLPALLLALFRLVYDRQPATFDRAAPLMLAIMPFVTMFVVTSITTLRERTSGTLERLMTLPVAKLDVLVGYALAFGLTTLAQVGLAVGAALGLGLDVDGSVPALAGVALLDALLGMALGLCVSAVASTEFQAVQFLPLVVFPQLLVGGILVPRDQMPGALQAVADAMPLSYAIEAVQRAAGTASGGIGGQVSVVAVVTVAAVALGAATLRRRTA